MRERRGEGVQVSAPSMYIICVSAPRSPAPPQLDNLPAMVAGVMTEDPQMQLEATTQFRKLLSIGARRRGDERVFEWWVGEGVMRERAV